MIEIDRFDFSSSRARFFFLILKKKKCQNEKQYICRATILSLLFSYIEDYVRRQVTEKNDRANVFLSRFIRRNNDIDFRKLKSIYHHACKSFVFFFSEKRHIDIFDYGKTQLDINKITAIWNMNMTEESIDFKSYIVKRSTPDDFGLQLKRFCQSFRFYSSVILVIVGKEIIIYEWFDFDLSFFCL